MSGQLDELLHSRQLAVYGREAMRKLSQHSVLISGLNGLGAEIAKNVILANVKSVTLHDNIATTFVDLSSHFYLSEVDIGVNRAEACAHKLQELNPNVEVNFEKGELSDDFVGAFQTVVIVDTYNPLRRLSENRLIGLDAMCRGHVPPINFITGDVAGVFGRCFCDFGPEFVVLDVDDKQPLSVVLASITVTSSGGETQLVVSCVDDERIEFSDGDFVTFSEVGGMHQLNGCAPVPVTVRSANCFTVPWKGELSSYTQGGIARQVKMGKTLNFRSLDSCLADPGQELVATGLCDPVSSARLHVCFRALHAYRIANAVGDARGTQSPPTGHFSAALPEAGDEDHAKLFHSLVKHVNNVDIRGPGKLSTEELDSDESRAMVTAFSRTARGNVSPTCAVLGGVIGQEVVKAATGKFHPVNQLLYVSFAGSLPQPLPSKAQCKPQGNRYDGQVMVFGRDLQQSLGDLRYFVAGAGAVGCELLKCLALMGVGVGEGAVVVADDGNIERSNLSRQFLFRNWHIGQNKAKLAREAVLAMNPTVRVQAFEDRVASGTESVYGDEFWAGLSGVCTALDSREARLHVASRCVFFLKPMIDVDTLGPKCTIQVAIPRLTENYGANGLPLEKQFADCTLSNFPHLIDHCLVWARSEFVDQFESAVSELKKLLAAASPSHFVETLRAAGVSDKAITDILKRALGTLNQAPKVFEDCVGWARLKFEELFANRIKQLVHCFPNDAKTRSGLPFWTAPKRFPQSLQFDPATPSHSQFIVAAARLWAQVFSVAVPDRLNLERCHEVARNAHVPEFQPDSNVRIQTDPNAEQDDQQMESARESSLQQLLDQVVRVRGGLSLSASSLCPEEFAKDNGVHTDFIAVAGNLRGQCYAIPPVDKLRAKLIAGRIVPAIATTAAMASGLACVELLKAAQGKGIDAFSETCANLATPAFTISRPAAVKKVVSREVESIPDPINHPEYVESESIVAYPEGHTVWDKLEVHNTANLTLEELAARFQREHGLELSSMVVNSSNGKSVIVYNSLMQNTAASLKKTVREVVEERMLVDPRSRKYIVPALMFENDEGSLVETPEVLLWL